jgi:hypothetical protein
MATSVGGIAAGEESMKPPRARRWRRISPRSRRRSRQASLRVPNRTRRSGGHFTGELLPADHRVRSPLDRQLVDVTDWRGGDREVSPGGA